MKWLKEKWRTWWLYHHPALQKMDPTGNTPGHGAPRCPICDGFIGKCDHEQG